MRKGEREGRSEEGRERGRERKGEREGGREEGRKEERRERGTVRSKKWVFACVLVVKTISNYSWSSFQENVFFNYVFKETTALHEQSHLASLDSYDRYTGHISAQSAPHCALGDN